MKDMNNSSSQKDSLFDRAKKLSLFARIVLTIGLSALWIIMASNFDLEIQTNWIISTFVITWISSIFFHFGK